MQQRYYPPKFGATAFNCPYCHVYAQQRLTNSSLRGSFPFDGRDLVFDVEGFYASKCSHCFKNAIWLGEELIFPEVGKAPIPYSDMPENVEEDYLEAVSISAKSPRGAAALLRLAIQKLCVHLGQSGKDLNNDIANLVKDGLPVKIQKALDIVRVIGNNAVHPGVIDLNDKPEAVYALYNLINQIVQDRITQPKEVNALYETLPEEARAAIEKRDTPKS